MIQNNLAQYVLTSTNQLGLQRPSYFESFTDMKDHVVSEIRNNLIENEATYKTIVDFDDAIEYDFEWNSKLDFENTFVKIDYKRQQITAKTSTVNNYGLEFFGELIPEKIEDKT